MAHNSNMSYETLAILAILPIKLVFSSKLDFLIQCDKYHVVVWFTTSAIYALMHALANYALVSKLTHRRTDK
jgi:hypothetical protein